MKHLLAGIVLACVLLPVPAPGREGDAGDPAAAREADDGYAWPDAAWDDPDAPAMDERMARRMDWIRAGAILGVQLGDSLHLQVGGKLAFFGLVWPSAYFYPIVQAFTFPVRGGEEPDVFSGLEAGYAWRSGADVVMLGVGFGVGVAGSSEHDVIGAGVRPTVRYRHYWGRFGLEVSAEIPLVLGSRLGGGSDFHAAGFFPLFGVSVGL